MNAGRDSPEDHYLNRAFCARDDAGIAAWKAKRTRVPFPSKNGPNSSVKPRTYDLGGQNIA